METSGADIGADMIDIGIKTMDLQTHPMRVHKDILISDLKEEVSRPTGIPREQQRLIYSGTALQDEHPLLHYNVQNGHKLHLVQRQLNAAAASSDDLTTDPPSVNGEDEASVNGENEAFVNGEDASPFTIHIHGHGTMDYARELVSVIMTALLMNLTVNPEISLDNHYVMTSLNLEAINLRQLALESGGGTHLAKAPNEQPLLNLLQSTFSVLSNLSQNVNVTHGSVANQSSDPESFLERLDTQSTDIQMQFSRTIRPEAAAILQSQRGGTSNNGVSSSNSDNSNSGTSSQDPDASAGVEDGMWRREMACVWWITCRLKSIVRQWIFLTLFYLLWAAAVGVYFRNRCEGFNTRFLLFLRRVEVSWFIRACFFLVDV